jgi:hypothetical protein
MTFQCAQYAALTLLAIGPGSAHHTTCVMLYACQ